MSTFSKQDLEFLRKELEALNKRTKLNYTLSDVLFITAKTLNKPASALGIEELIIKINSL